MKNIVLMKSSKMLLKKSKELGFLNFLTVGEDLRLVVEKSNSKLNARLNKIKQEDSKIKTIVEVSDEKQLRFALDKTKKKGVCFSFSRFLAEKNKRKRARMLARMNFNYRLCEKYGVKVLVNNFSKDLVGMRPKAEILAFGKVLAKKV